MPLLRITTQQGLTLKITYRNKISDNFIIKLSINYASIFATYRLTSLRAVPNLFSTLL